MEVWVLYYWIMSNDSRPRRIVGGEYSTEMFCRAAGRQNLWQAKQWFGRHVTWTCELTRDDG